MDVESAKRYVMIQVKISQRCVLYLHCVCSYSDQ